MNKRVLGILLLGYKEGQYTHKEVVDKILERSDNSDYAVPPSATPKVCPNCNSAEYMYYHKSGKWYCEDCMIKGLGQTFA